MKRTEIKTIYGQIEGVVAHEMATERKVNLIPLQHVPESHLINEHGLPAVCAVVFNPASEREFNKRVADLRA
jgi:hypothetical protein